MTYPADDVSKLEGLVAESWSVSDDGKQVTFKIRDGIKFHSGNPLTAKDVAYSLQRVVELNLSPGFILTQFGFTPENMAETIKATDDSTLVLTLDKPYAPTFLLYCLTAGVGSVVDSKLVEEHEKDGDMGHDWLKTNSAGSGPFKLRAWKPNESVVARRQPRLLAGCARLQARDRPPHPRDRRPSACCSRRATSTSPASSRPRTWRRWRQNPDITIEQVAQGRHLVHGPEPEEPEYLAKPEVREALKWLVDYDGIVDNILQGQGAGAPDVPARGLPWAPSTTRPTSSIVAKAKELLAKAGLPDGFKVTMDARNNSPTKDMAQAIQATLGAGRRRRSRSSRPTTSRR